MFIYPVTKESHIGTKFQANAFLDYDSAELFCAYEKAHIQRYKMIGKPADGVQFTHSKTLLENSIGIPYGYRYRITVKIYEIEYGLKAWSIETELLDRCSCRFDCISYVNLKKEESSFSFETMSQYEIHSYNESIHPKAVTQSDYMLNQLVLNMLVELDYIKIPEPETTSFEIIKEDVL